MFVWTYAGVDLTIPGVGGPDCVEYLNIWTLHSEAAVSTIISFLMLMWAWRAPRGLTLPLLSDYMPRESAMRRILLLAHSLVFGAELGFKLATKSLIWLLNPCHMVTMTQIFLLAFPATPLTTALFRLHMHMLNGPLLALIFPVLNTRLLPSEQLVYYVQHVFILLLPLFLIKEGGVFTVEPINNLSWAMVSFVVQSTYHFLFLQYVSLRLQINLDNMLCPAISDPFRGPHYRKWAYGHQMIMILFLGKIITFAYQRFLNRFYPGAKTLIMVPPLQQRRDNNSTVITSTSSPSHAEVSLESVLHRSGFITSLVRRQIVSEVCLLEHWLRFNNVDTKSAFYTDTDVSASSSNAITTATAETLQLNHEHVQ